MAELTKFERNYTAIGGTYWTLNARNSISTPRPGGKRHDDPPPVPVSPDGTGPEGGTQ